MFMKSGKVKYGLVVIGLTVFVWQYFFLSRADMEEYKKLTPALLAQAEKDGLLTKYSDIKCHNIYLKDEEDLNIEACLGSTKPHSYHVTKKILSLFSINFQAIEVQKNIYHNPEVMSYIKIFIRDYYIKNDQPLLLMILQSSEYYNEIDGIDYDSVRMDDEVLNSWQQRRFQG